MLALTGRTHAVAPESPPPETTDVPGNHPIAAPGAGADMVVLDTAPHAAEAALEAARASDFVLIPCRPATADLAARGFREHRGVKAATVLIVLASVAYTSVYQPLAQYRAQPILFPERLQNIRAHYTDVPAGTVVLYGPRHLPFLRPDLRVILARRITSPDRFRGYIDQAHKAGIPVYVADEDRPPTVIVQ